MHSDCIDACKPRLSFSVSHVFPAATTLYSQINRAYCDHALPIPPNPFASLSNFTRELSTDLRKCLSVCLHVLLCVCLSVCEIMCVSVSLQFVHA